MKRDPTFESGDVIVEYKCGVKVMRSAHETMTDYGDGERGAVFRVYSMRWYVDGRGEWGRDTRVFTRAQALVEAAKRVDFEIGYRAHHKQWPEGHPDPKRHR